MSKILPRVDNQSEKISRTRTEQPSESDAIIINES